MKEVELTFLGSKYFDLGYKHKEATRVIMLNRQSDRTNKDA